MSSLDLYSASNNPTPEQLLDVCARFMPILNAVGKKTWVEVTDTAQRLAEQILGHYQTLGAVSKETRHLSKPGEKLPYQVLHVFLYACVDEHPAMGLIMEELEKLYADGTDPKAQIFMQGLWKGSLLNMATPPKLWAEDGTLKYSPSAYAQMHLSTLYRELTDRWREGVPGIQKVLDDYPLMNEASKKLIDAELCFMVYKWTQSEDHPLRILLADKVNVGFDGRARFENLIENLDFETVSEFEERFEFAFALLKGLPKYKVDWVLKAIDGCIAGSMNSGIDDVQLKLDCPEQCIPRLVKILEAASAYGYSPLPQIYREYSTPAEEFKDQEVLEDLISMGFTADPDDIDMAVAWREAAIIAADEKLILSLDLDEQDLAQLSIRKNGPGIRAALLKTTTGRDIVFGQDLGL
ncbi:hypothetical protein [Pseudomonas amygdali]|uniref:Uncharacterized protein n=2 Tax=Pseudomonas amygdali pv. lachrymans TaxID=53707 RepID=A0ABR5KR55_PSEAV|nr:hypothetical protein [Pseudomonas amygdali]AXH59852.1 hypothetical protein PLA107_032015 [Pseudomonas amygdali pv. lachrymans str. M301315]KPC17269.1 Uncharacterized protein AC499_0471 [Pseudomonas amygdali pv. lachrymans]KPC18228.1 Uncharacterized protein AC499_1430 [Pseudomonas amygdali pv. lachrymans]RMT06230.1 hypothetical protein ALP54_03732 [Pseudomonas amygdali pv. lachrymans]